MVFSWNIRKIVKKKYFVSNKDKINWLDFTKNIDNIIPKENSNTIQSLEGKKINKLDLHGFSLEDSNRRVNKFIIDSFNLGLKKVLIVTGKGKRSKSYDNPYISEKLGVLRYSIPEYLKNNENLKNKIIKISKADERDGGDGALYIYLKKNKNL